MALKFCNFVFLTQCFGGNAHHYTAGRILELLAIECYTFSLSPEVTAVNTITEV